VKSALQSGCAHSIIMACTVLQEGAYVLRTASARLPDDDPKMEMVPILHRFIDSPAPTTYTELGSTVDRLFVDTQSALSLFPASKSVPIINKETFTIAAAQKLLQSDFDVLVKQIPGPKKVALQDRKKQMYASIGYHTITKERLDARVGAAVASALLAMQKVPEKHGPLVRAIMNAIKVRITWNQLTAGRRI
jgi:TATA-binding protein-associated factor